MASEMSVNRQFCKHDPDDPTKVRTLPQNAQQGRGDERLNGLDISGHSADQVAVLFSSCSANDRRWIW